MPCSSMAASTRFSRSTASAIGVADEGVAPCAPACRAAIAVAVAAAVDEEMKVRRDIDMGSLSPCYRYLVRSIRYLTVRRRWACPGHHGNCWTSRVGTRCNLFGKHGFDQKHGCISVCGSRVDIGEGDDGGVTLWLVEHPRTESIDVPGMPHQAVDRSEPEAVAESLEICCLGEIKPLSLKLRAQKRSLPQVRQPDAKISQRRDHGAGGSGNQWIQLRHVFRPGRGHR